MLTLCQTARKPGHFSTFLYGQNVQMRGRKWGGTINKQGQMGKSLEAGKKKAL